MAAQGSARWVGLPSGGHGQRVETRLGSLRPAVWWGSARRRASGPRSPTSRVRGHDTRSVTCRGIRPQGWDPKQPSGAKARPQAKCAGGEKWGREAHFFDPPKARENAPAFDRASLPVRGEKLTCSGRLKVDKWRVTVIYPPRLGNGSKALPPPGHSYLSCREATLYIYRNNRREAGQNTQKDSYLYDYM